jgi:mannose-1-phosphate guanylyltransferase
MKIIVFAGGVGSRLWPLSRKNTPKQFGKIVGDYSTLQLAIQRLLPEFNANDIFIATGKKYEETVKEQLPMIPQDNFIFEPTMRDVGPAIGLVSFLLEKKFGDEPIAILWSDHLLKREDTFRHMLKMAEEQITNKEANFIFIGQEPRFANQNCGWIELGEKLGNKEEAQMFEFKRLWYAPKQQEAEDFFHSKKYVWNLGYFITTPNYITDLFKQYVPDMYEKLQQIQAAYQTDQFNSKLDEIYPTLEKINFDNAILVKLNPDGFKVISADLGWSDIGAWDALKEALSESKEQNITSGNVMLEQTTDSLLFNYTDKLCVGIDLSEMIIINTEDVLLVCPKSSVPKIKTLVQRLTGTDNEHLV